MALTQQETDVIVPGTFPSLGWVPSSPGPQLLTLSGSREAFGAGSSWQRGWARNTVAAHLGGAQHTVGSVNSKTASPTSGPTNSFWSASSVVQPCWDLKKVSYVYIPNHACYGSYANSIIWELSLKLFDLYGNYQKKFNETEDFIVPSSNSVGHLKLSP